MAALTDPDLLFAPETRTLARSLYAGVKDLPIVSPHGHTDPRWYALNEPFPDPAQLLIVPDHYIFRMLFSQGVRLEELGVTRLDSPTPNGAPVETDGRAIWRRFAEHYYLFRGTPTRLWLDHVFEHLFGIDEPLDASTADRHYDTIAALLGQDDYRPRALFERFNIEVIATTEGALDDLKWHRMIRDSGWQGRVVTAYRPDAVVDPDFEGFLTNLDRLGEITGCDTGTWAGYLEAHRQRRAYFKAFGATSSDTFMDMGPMIIICTPIFLPLVQHYGVDPVHFGVITILNLGIGLNTPPVGTVQFVACAVGKITVWEAMRSIWPFYGAGIVVLGLVTYIPAISLWLPSVFR